MFWFGSTFLAKLVYFILCPYVLFPYVSHVRIRYVINAISYIYIWASCYPLFKLCSKTTFIHHVWFFKLVSWQVRMPNSPDEASKPVDLRASEPMIRQLPPASGSREVSDPDICPGRKAEKISWGISRSRRSLLPWRLAQFTNSLNRI